MSVALPQAHTHGRSSSNESTVRSSSMSLQLRLLWRNMLFCVLPNAPTAARSHRCTLPPCLTSVQGYSRNPPRCSNAPPSTSQKGNVYVCNHYNSFYLLRFKKKEIHVSLGCHRHRDSQGVNVWLLLGPVPVVVYKLLELFLLPLVAAEPHEWFYSLAVTPGLSVILYVLPLITCCPVRFCSDASHHVCVTVTWPQLKSVIHFLFQGTWEMFPGTL